MNTIQISKCLAKHSRTSQYFVGVYAADALPQLKIQDDEQFLIANTDNSYEKGKHWVLMWIPGTAASSKA